ncbi:LysE family translocator [Hwanghaeella grinnelliae]|nr:LysE family translocator [Hwanghaeella grinnelliae]
MALSDILISVAAIVAVNFAAWITPGPNMIAVISAAVSAGRPAGLATGLGLALGTVIWAGLALAGVTVLFDVFPDVAFALRLLGAGYLFWLGMKALRAAAEDDCSLLPGKKTSPGHTVLKGAFITGLSVSLTNPKAALFFGSILTAFVPRAATDAYLIGVVALCGLLAVCFHSTTAFVFSTPFAIRKFNDGRRRITAGFGVVFSGMALAVAYDALRR